MRDKSTTIDGYKVELCWFDENSNSCHVSRRINGTEYCSSLAAIMGHGGDFEEEANKPIPDTTVHKIEEWALANGY